MRVNVRVAAIGALLCASSVAAEETAWTLLHETAKDDFFIRTTDIGAGAQGGEEAMVRRVIKRSGEAIEGIEFVNCPRGYSYPLSIRRYDSSGKLINVRRFSQNTSIGKSTVSRNLVQVFCTPRS
jgi:hypothetical protein